MLFGIFQSKSFCDISKYRSLGFRPTEVVDNLDVILGPTTVLTVMISYLMILIFIQIQAKPSCYALLIFTFN